MRRPICRAIRQLGDKGYATPQLVDTQKAQVAQLQAPIKADEALIDRRQVQLGYTRLTSPIPGITGIRQIDVGNIIHPTDPNGLVVVTQIEPISVIFTLPQTDLPADPGPDGEGAAEGHCLQPGRQDQARRRQALLVDNEILQTTGTIRLKAEFPNHSASALAGAAGQCAAAARDAQRTG